MNKVPESTGNELAALAIMAESDADFSDLPVPTAQDCMGAAQCEIYRPVKQQLTVRILKPVA